jgi:hypothetical protein
MDIEYMRKAHKYTNDNVWYLVEPQDCICIYCLNRFNSTEIIDYSLDDTAICPYCLVDGVIGEKSGYIFTDDEAIMMYEFFFNSGDGTYTEHILDLELLEKFKDLL